MIRGGDCVVDRPVFAPLITRDDSADEFVSRCDSTLFRAGVYFILPLPSPPIPSCLPALQPVTRMGCWARREGDWRGGVGGGGGVLYVDGDIFSDDLGMDSSSSH